MRYIIGGVVVLIILCGLYFSVNPATSHIMPKCPFHLLTGLDCPACGIQRAFHSFLHGEWSMALRYNYFLIISLPYCLAVVITTFGRNRYAELARGYIQHPRVVRIFMALTFVWWIVRNIPSVQTFLQMQ